MIVQMDDQLKQLLDYTKFHIGMYTTLTTTIIAVFANDKLKQSYTAMIPFIKATVVLLGVAGAAGGLVASSIPSYTDYVQFSKSALGPWDFGFIPALTCIHVEHTAFWVSMLISVAGLFKAMKEQSAPVDLAE